MKCVCRLAHLRSCVAVCTWVWFHDNPLRAISQRFLRVVSGRCSYHICLIDAQGRRYSERILYAFLDTGYLEKRNVRLLSSIFDIR